MNDTARKKPMKEIKGSDMWVDLPAVQRQDREVDIRRRH